MFFLMLLSVKLLSSEISSSTVSYTILDSLYDKRFTNLAIEYFRDNWNFDITTDTESLTCAYQIKRNGVSRTELVFLFKYAFEMEYKLCDILNSIQKNETIFDNAKRNGYDINKNFKLSIKIKKEIENNLNDIIDILKPVIEKEFLNEKK